MGTSEVEEVRRKFEFTNDFELSKLLANAADARRGRRLRAGC